MSEPTGGLFRKALLQMQKLHWLMEEEKLPQLILFMRLLNMGTALLLMTEAILVMLKLPTPTQWVLAFYALFSGLLVCCLETQLRFFRLVIAMKFGYIFNGTTQFLVVFMRLLNMGTALLLMTEVILVMLKLPTTTQWVLAFYALFSGLLVSCPDTRLRILVKGTTRFQLLLFQHLTG